MTTERLFVYGSLKRGGLHHAELADARFLAEAQTVPGYGLVPLGGYLALVPESGSGSVSGELFEVDSEALPALDEFEGSEYTRATIDLAPGVVFGGESGESGAKIDRALAYLKRAR